MDLGIDRVDGVARLRALGPFLRSAGAEVESVMVGSSMCPTIPDGTKIRIECGDTDCRVGQVVAIVDGDRLMIHRVVYSGRGQARDYLVSCGDARRLPDIPIHRQSVIGVVTAVHDGPTWTDLHDGPTPRHRVSPFVLNFVCRGLQLHPPTAMFVGRFLTKVRNGYRRARRVTSWRH